MLGLKSYRSKLELFVEGKFLCPNENVNNNKAMPNEAILRLGAILCFAGLLTAQARLDCNLHAMLYFFRAFPRIAWFPPALKTP